MGKSKDVKKEKKKPKSTAPKQSKSKKQYQLGKSNKRTLTKISVLCKNKKNTMIKDNLYWILLGLALGFAVYLVDKYIF